MLKMPRLTQVVFLEHYNFPEIVFSSMGWSISIFCEMLLPVMLIPVIKGESEIYKITVKLLRKSTSFCAVKFGRNLVKISGLMEW